MADHFRFYPSSEEITIPFNARYSFPSQANKAVKITPRIPPKNGATFSAGQTIRLEFPAQGYVNTSNLTFEMDVQLTPNHTPAAGTFSSIRFQNSIQSLFTRVRILYGSTPLEDILGYNVVNRMLTEWTSSSGYVMDQTSVSEGIGGVFDKCNDSAAPSSIVPISSRSAIHGVHTVGTAAFFTPCVKNGAAVRRYQFQLGLGLLQQGKLLPTKFMASQLAIELTLARDEECIIQCTRLGTATANVVSNPRYTVTNINMIPEILEFDASYDNMFLKGLQEGGVPIKFSSWHTYQFSHPGGNTANILIQERSRSVKSIFTIIRRQAQNLLNDSGATHANLVKEHILDSFQYRIGGRYFPASPVQVSGGDQFDIGGCEAFVELQKALNTVGDSRLSTNVSSVNWAPRYNDPSNRSIGEGNSTTPNESDYVMYTSAPNSSNTIISYAPDSALSTPSAQGVPNLGSPSACFCMATNLETSSGMEISGLNAEEQSDISLNIKWLGPEAPPAGQYVIETYVFYDAMIVLRENNVYYLLTIGSRIDPVINKNRLLNKVCFLIFIMDYIEFEIDSSYAATSSVYGYAATDTPSVDLGRTLTNVVGAKIVEANIPYTYYPVCATTDPVRKIKENVFWIQNQTILDNRFECTIPEGFYTATTLAAAMKFAIENPVQIGAIPMFGAPYTATVTFTELTGRFTVSVIAASYLVSGGVMDMVFSPEDYPSQLAQTFGARNRNHSNVVSPAGLMWDFPYVAQVTGPNNLYINSDILGNVCKAFIPESSLTTGETNPQMCMIPVNVNPGGVIWWQDPVPNEVFDIKNLFSISKVDFYLTAGTVKLPLKLNGVGFQLKLILYVKNREEATSSAGTMSQNRSVLQIRPT